MENAKSLFRVFDLAFFAPGGLLLVSAWQAGLLTAYTIRSEGTDGYAAVIAVLAALLGTFMAGALCHAAVRLVHEIAWCWRKRKGDGGNRADSTVPAGTSIPADAVISAGTIIPAGTTIPAGTNIPQGVLAAGVVIPTGLSIAPGTTVSAGTVISAGTIIPAGSDRWKAWYHADLKHQQQFELAHYFWYMRATFSNLAVASPVAACIYVFAKPASGWMIMLSLAGSVVFVILSREFGRSLRNLTLA